MQYGYRIKQRNDQQQNDKTQMVYYQKLKENEYLLLNVFQYIAMSSGKRLLYEEGVSVSGHSVDMLCPFHEDTTPSMSLSRTENGEYLWYCHACGHGGSILDAVALHLGIPVRGNLALIREKIYRYSSIAQSVPPNGNQVSLLMEHMSQLVPLRGGVCPPLDKNELEACERLNNNLLEAENLSRFQDEIGILPETLKFLAQSNDYTLGLSEEGALCIFLRDSEGMIVGCKVRLKEDWTQPFSLKRGIYRTFPRDGRPFHFAVGGASLYGGSILPHKSNVIVCESESDHWALVQMMLSMNVDQSCWPAVVSTGGCNNMRSIKPENFLGKNVLIAFDQDEVGQAGMRKLSSCLQHVAQNVSQLQLPIHIKDVRACLNTDAHKQILKNNIQHYIQYA